MTDISIACPIDMISDANQLAATLAFSVDDLHTFATAEWQDDDARLYAVASFHAGPDWIRAAQAQLSRPDWDNVFPYHVNMAGARRAQDALVLWDATQGTTAPQANIGELTALIGFAPHAALIAMGLFAKPAEDD